MLANQMMSTTVDIFQVARATCRTIFSCAPSRSAKAVLLKRGSRPLEELLLSSVISWPAELHASLCDAHPTLTLLRNRWISPAIPLSRSFRISNFFAIRRTVPDAATNRALGRAAVGRRRVDLAHREVYNDPKPRPALTAAQSLEPGAENGDRWMGGARLRERGAHGVGRDLMRIRS